MDGHAFATTELGQETYGGAALPVIERYVMQQGSSDVDASCRGPCSLARTCSR
jgi:hypothetical protein